MPIAVIWLASLVVLWAVLLRPDWARVRTVGRFLTDGLSLVLAAILLRVDAVVQLAPGVEPTPEAGRVVRFINAQAQDRRADLAARLDLADLRRDRIASSPRRAPDPDRSIV